MAYILDDYDSVLENILHNGNHNKNQRTNQDSLSVHGVQCRYNVSQYFPILTRRKLNFSANIAELLWFIEGSTNINRLKELGCGYWEPWRDDAFTNKNDFVSGSIGMSYGHQLRHFGQAKENCQDYCGTSPQYGMRENENVPTGLVNGIDQLQKLINGISKDPSDRGLIINLWNPVDLEQMKLRPCAYAFQILINNGLMDLILMQRSADWPIGVPYNLTFYATLLHLLAFHTGYVANELIHQVGNAHIYSNQIPGVYKYLERPKIAQPKLSIKIKSNLRAYTVSDFQLIDYIYCAPDIKFEVAV